MGTRLLSAPMFRWRLPKPSMQLVHRTWLHLLHKCEERLLSSAQGTSPDAAAAEWKTMRSRLHQHQGLCDAEKSLLSKTSSLLTAGYNNIDSGYAFGYDSIAFGPMSDMISYQRDLVKHTAFMSLVGCSLTHITQGGCAAWPP